MNGLHQASAVSQTDKLDPGEKMSSIFGFERNYHQQMLIRSYLGQIFTPHSLHRVGSMCFVSSVSGFFMKSPGQSGVMQALRYEVASVSLCCTDLLRSFDISSWLLVNKSATTNLALHP